MSHICGTYYHIHNLRHIHLYLSVSNAKPIAAVLVTTILGYYNLLFHNTGILC